MHFSKMSGTERSDWTKSSNVAIWPLPPVPGLTDLDLSFFFSRSSASFLTFSSFILKENGQKCLHKYTYLEMILERASRNKFHGMDFTQRVSLDRAHWWNFFSSVDTKDETESHETKFYGFNETRFMQF